MKQPVTPRMRWRRPSGVLAVLVGLCTFGVSLELFTPPLASAQRRVDRRRRRPPYRRGRAGAASKTGGSTGFKDLAGETAFNECKRYPYYKRVKVTLKPDSELHDLVAWISGMTCKRFIITGTIRAPKVTIVSPTPITPREAYRAFLSALNAMGLTVQPAGRYLKIIEIANAAPRPVATCRPGRTCPRDDRVITQMIRLKHVEPDDVANVLRNLTKGSIITYAPTNLLIITDSGSNVSRLVKIIKNLDVEAEDEKIWIVRVKHAEAPDLAAKLLEIFPAADGSKGGNRRAAPRRRYNRRRRRRRTPPRQSLVSVKGSGSGLQVSKIIADERTNVLIIVAEERSYLRVRALIRKLDIPVAGGEEKIHIVALANADAQELAGTLSGLTGGSSGSRARSSRSRRGRTTRRSSRSRNRRTSRGRSGGAVNLFQGDVQITEDQSTNSLIIVASMKDYMQLMKVIKRLDQPRRQVFVEASILEVNITKQRDLGLSFHGGLPVGSGDNQSLLLGGNNATNSIFLDPSSLMGLAVGLRGPELKNAESLLGIPGISFPSFGVFFQALQKNDDVNIVSSPHILTTDNEEAEISVGENVPFQSSISGMGGLSGLTGATGSTTSALGGYYPMQSIQRQDVALTLKITPHINESDYVRLEIDQEINEVKSIDPVVGPTTTKRKVKTVVVVKDQQTVVIGGLITEKVKENVQKVPLLGDIPILGYLFKTTTRIIEKNNLLLFLTPYVIRDQEDLRRIFRRKIQQRKEFIERYTAFKDIDLDAVIDYRHKRGLLEEINRVARLSEEEAAMRKKAILESKEPDVDGPVRAHPDDVKMLKQLQKESEPKPKGPKTQTPPPAPRKRATPAKRPRPEPRRTAPRGR